MNPAGRMTEWERIWRFLPHPSESVVGTARCRRFTRWEGMRLDEEVVARIHRRRSVVLQVDPGVHLISARFGRISSVPIQLPRGPGFDQPD